MAEKVIIIPPDWYFENKRSPNILDKFPVAHVAGDTAEKVILEDSGAKIVPKGYAMPKKGFPYAFAIDAINTFKKGTMIILFLISIFPPIILLLAIPKLKKRFIELYASFSDWIFCIYYPDPMYYCEFSKEILRLGFMFANSSDERLLLKGVAFTSDCENAYRYRIQDFFEELNTNSFIRSPVSEFNRAMKICEKRELGGIRNKWKMARIVGISMLLLPSIRKLAKELTKTAKWDQLRFDEIDRYWISFRTDYEFLGLSIEERSKWRNK